VKTKTKSKRKAEVKTIKLDIDVIDLSIDNVSWVEFANRIDKFDILNFPPPSPKLNPDTIIIKETLTDSNILNVHKSSSMHKIPLLPTDRISIRTSINKTQLNGIVIKQKYEDYLSFGYIPYSSGCKKVFAIFKNTDNAPHVYVVYNEIVSTEIKLPDQNLFDIVPRSYDSKITQRDSIRCLNIVKKFEALCAKCNNLKDFYETFIIELNKTGSSQKIYRILDLLYKASFKTI